MIVTADVGAGYTGVLVGRDETALIDFGGESAGGAVNALSRVADRHRWPRWWTPPRPMLPPPFNAFLLSHPHKDHYNGLLALAKEPTRALRPLLTAEACFYHPRLPTDRVAAEFLAREVALERVMSGRPDDALTHVLSACCAGRPVSRTPLSRDEPVELAGEVFDVLWPPDQLPAEAKSNLRKLVDRYDAVADEAASEGDTRLKDALDRVGKPNTVDIEDAMYGPAEPPHDADQVERAKYDLTDKSPIQDSDDPHYEQLEALAHTVKDGANLLSLVLASKVHRRYVFLGDLAKSLHGAIAPDLVDSEPEVVSSAHHGTHLGPELEDLRSRYVVSSVGGKLENNVCPGYDSMGMHLRTDKAGDIFALMRSGRTAVRTRPTP